MAHGKVNRTQDEITTCLTILAAYVGNCRAASEVLLEDHNIEISSATLQRFRDVRHVEEYHKIRDEVQANVDPVLISEIREILVSALHAQRLALDSVVKRLEDGHDARPAETLKMLQPILNGGVDRLQLLLGRPTQISETRDADQIIRSLEQLGVEVNLEKPQLANGRE